MKLTFSGARIVFALLTAGFLTTPQPLSGSHSPAREPNRQSSRGSRQARPIGTQTRLLVRGLSTGELALDGLLFLVTLDRDASSTAAPLKDDLLLRSAPPLQVEQENASIVKNPSGNQWGNSKPDWKLDLSGFDYLVEWTRESSERPKSLGQSADLIISVTETWNLQKTADASVMKNWTASYELRRAFLDSDKDREARAATAQNRLVVAPVRGPILKAIRQFVVARPEAPKGAPR